MFLNIYEEFQEIKKDFKIIVGKANKYLLSHIKK